MTIKQIKNRIQAAEQNLAEARAKLAELEQPDDGKPKVGDMYWHLASTGYSPSTWHGDDADEARWWRGNVYKTEADVARADMKRIVTAKLERIADKYPPCDWNDEMQQKYCIQFSYYVTRWIGNICTRIKRQGTVYASDERYVEEALALGDELNVLLEG